MYISSSQSVLFSREVLVRAILLSQQGACYVRATPSSAAPLRYSYMYY